MNSFCKYCTGGNKEEILKCDDINCPFWRCRKNDLPHQKRNRKESKLAISFDGSIGKAGIYY